MEKEFCNYNQSLQLKLIGFDEPCLARHAIITEWENPTGEVKFQMIDCLKSDKNLIKAPLYQQAFRWFREKYKYDHSIVMMKHPFGTDEYQYLILLNEDEYVKTGFNTYEEAEDACLDKLIEIVKNK